MNIVDQKLLRKGDEIESYSEREHGGSEVGPSGINLDFLFDFVRRHVWMILSCVLLTSALGVAYFLAVPAPYTAVATLTIDMRKFQLFQQQANLGEQVIDSSAAVESQLEVMKSENIALTVIKDLRLADDPDFGQAAPLPGLLGAILPSTPDSEFRRTRRALGVIEKSLKVKRIGVAFVIEISFEAVNSERAAQIANAIAEAYIADQLEAKYHATRQGSSWLEGRLKELRDQVAVAQKAVNDYKAQNKIVDTGNGRLISEQQLSDLNGQLTAARAKTGEARVRLERLNTVLSDQTGDAIVNASVSDVLNNQLITKLRTQYSEAAARESELSEKFGRSHLAVVNLRSTMRGLRNAMRSELERLQNSYKNDFEIANEGEKSIEKQLQQAVGQSQVSSEAQVTLRDLDVSAQAYKALYDNFLRRYTEAVEQQSFPYTEARLITKATPPQQRTYRKTLLIIALTPFFGLFLGAGVAGLREFFDRGFRTSSQLETALGTNCIALIPRQKSEPAPKQSALRNASDGVAGQALIAQDYGAARVIVDQPFSKFAEAIRTIKLAIDLNGVMSASRVIGLTSSIPGEGKSTVAAALARSIAQVGARCILVDCDIRNPSLTRVMAPNASAGLFEAISDSVPLSQLLWRDPSTPLAFLPATLKMRIAHSSEVLASNATKRLIEKLRHSYDYVIVDLPPLAPLVDVRATTQFIDSYIFVAEWGQTPAAVAQHALARAPNIHDRILGAVLNKVDMKQVGRYDGYRARYYNDKGYARYGYTD